MKRVDVQTERPYAVQVGRAALGLVRSEIEPPFALVSDANVGPLYARAVGIGAPIHLLPPGEEAKTFAILEALLDAMAAARLDRRGTLVALGGGCVGDVAGLAASLYMRGIDVVQCPTTLLAMGVASVGGKTAVNLAAGKNLAGTVHQPLAVFADLDVLATLPEVERRSGLGEVVKSALIGDSPLLDFLEANAAAVDAGDLDVLGEVVWRCVRVKAAVVAADELEAGGRRALNLGHTFAHAIEQVAGYGVVPHGLAVAVGLALALAASDRIGLLEDRGLGQRVARLLGRLGLPAGLEELRDRSRLRLAPRALADAMALDKKGASGEPRFVLVGGAGDVRIDVPLDPNLVAELLS